MPQPFRPWNQVPRDPAMSAETYQFLVWVQQSIMQLLSAVIILPAPEITTKGLHQAVRIDWDEVPGALKYYIFENVTAALPSNPLAVIPANLARTKNSYLRSGLTDTNTRYYAVQAVGPNESKGALSAFKTGFAASI